jgi:hypothetical protein
MLTNVSIFGQTMHFKLLNAVARTTAELKLPADDELSAARFHRDMLLSGVERIIAVSSIDRFADRDY